MLPKTPLPAVELVIPSDEFFDAMSDIGKWLAGHHIVCPYCTSCQNRAGDHDVRFAFPGASEAADFAQRFDGHLAGCAAGEANRDRATRPDGAVAARASFARSES